jgi:hypothetical protein
VEGEEMEEDIAHFPEGTDEERYVEPYGTTTLHDTGHVQYITLVLLFMFFFTLLPFFWAGWLSSVPFVRYN